MPGAQAESRSFREPHQRSWQGQPNNPAAVVLLTVMFALPVFSTSFRHYLLLLGLLMAFVIFVFFQARQQPLSLLKKLKQQHNVLFCLLAAFSLSSLVSYLFVLFGDAGYIRKIIVSIRFVMYLTIGAYVFALARFCMLKHITHRHLFIAYLCGTLAFIALLLVIYHFSVTPNAENWAVELPFGRHLRIAGLGAAIACVAAITLFLFGSNSFNFSVLLWLGILICSAFLIWTGSRGSMASAVFAVFLLIVLLLVYKKTSYTKILLLVFGIGLSVLVADRFSIFPWSGLQRAIDVSTIDAPAAVGQVESAFHVADKITSGRMVLWKASLEAVKLSPWFGYGPNATLFVLQKPDHPHNLILQFLLEWGVIGTVLLLAILVNVAWHGLKKLPYAVKNGHADYIVSAAVIFMLTLSGLTDGTFYHFQLIVCLATAFAIFPFFPLGQKGLPYHSAGVGD